MTGRFPHPSFGAAFDINAMERALRDALLRSQRAWSPDSWNSPGEVGFSAVFGHQDLGGDYFPWNRQSSPNTQPGLTTNQMFGEKSECTNPAGVIGSISLAEFSSSMFQPGIRPIPKNYSFDSMDPAVTAYRFGTSYEKYWGVTSSPTEMVYMSNRSSHDVIGIDPDYGRNPIVKISRATAPAMEKPLFRPTGVAFDNHGNRLIVADKDNHRIVIFTTDGRFISQFGDLGFEIGQFSYPWDVAVSPDGNRIAVSDSRNHRIQVFDRFGNFLNKFSVIENNPYNFRDFFDYPRGITFDLSGKSMFVTDFNTHSIWEIETDTMAYRKMKLKYINNEELLRPQGITMDNQGNLVVCDTKNNYIRVFNISGKEICTVDNIGSRPFNTPTDLTFLANNNMLVMDVNGKVGVF